MEYGKIILFTANDKYFVIIFYYKCFMSGGRTKNAAKALMSRENKAVFTALLGAFRTDFTPLQKAIILFTSVHLDCLCHPDGVNTYRNGQPKYIIIKQFGSGSPC